MIKVTFYFQDKRKIETEGILGESLMELAKRYKINEIRATCGGKLSCSTCHVIIKTPNILRNNSEREVDLLYNLGEPYPLETNTAYSRLSCQIILEKNLDGLEVEVV